MGYFSLFLQISQITCLQMENFVVAILYLVYFALKCMYFEDLLVESHFQDYKSFVTLITQLEIHEQGGNPVC